MWLWRKKSSEKTVVASEKGNFSSMGSEQEVIGSSCYNHAKLSIAYLVVFLMYFYFPFFLGLCNDVKAQ